MRDMDNCLQLRHVALRLRSQSQASRSQQSFQEGYLHHASSMKRPSNRALQRPTAVEDTRRRRNLPLSSLTLRQVIVISTRALSPQKDAHVATDNLRLNTNEMSMISMRQTLRHQHVTRHTLPAPLPDTSSTYKYPVTVSVALPCCMIYPLACAA
jgi:hypothetical protein